jgi:ribosomal protein L24
MVDLRRNVVYVDSITRKTAKGKEIQIPIYSSNVYLTDLDLGDKLRSEKIDVFKAKK